jgi:hypothetical protein
MIFVIVATGVAIGFLAGVHRKMDLELWTVGGRGFGAVLMFLLMAGEVYTTFSFLGASGWAYSRGGPTLYIMAYLTLAYVVSFFILPQIWEVGRKYGMQTQSDFFTTRYGNKYLAGFVCGWYRVFYSLPAAPDNRGRYYRLDRQLRWHRPYTSYGDFGRSVGGLRFCQRCSGSSLGQRSERCADGLCGSIHWHRYTLYPFWRDRSHVHRAGA